MSMVMVKYIYGISNIRDNCYELNMRQRQPQEHQPDLLLFLVWMNCQHHKLESSGLDLDLHVVYGVVYSLHAYNYMLRSIH